ncbi:MAG: hypothetical protein EXR75_04795 [Myxococcales bacterium]|nr:hypothetical protein [Myxococcales bacterium]
MNAFDAATVPLSGRNVVEASAGTGKTHAITTLVVRLVLERALALDEILIVTFTEAAASELRRRVRARLQMAQEALHELEKRALANQSPSLIANESPSLIANESPALIANESPALIANESPALIANDLTPLLDDVLRRQSLGIDEVRIRLAAAERDADEASIFTLHGFCQRAALENASFVAACPDAELATDDTFLLTEVSNDFWACDASRADRVLVDALAARDVTPSSVAQFLKRATGSRATPLRPLLGPLLPLDTAPLFAAFAGLASVWDEQSVRTRVAAMRLGGKGRADYVAKWSAQITGYLKTTHADDAAAALAGVPKDLKRFTTCALSDAGAKNLGDPEPWSSCQRFVDAVSVFMRAVDDHVVLFKQRLVRYARTELARRKSRLSLRSFDDLIYDLRDALAGPTGSALAGRLRRRYRAALVDEFQDTDPAQWEILRSIWPRTPASKREGDDSVLMLIGDPKQAIYGFRGADVFAYLDARDSVPESSRYTMTCNYRSDQGLVHANHCVFLGAPSAADFDEDAARGSPARFAAPGSRRASPPFLMEAIHYPVVTALPKPECALVRHDGVEVAPLRIAFSAERHASKSALEALVLEDLASDVALTLSGGESGLEPRMTLSGRAVRPSDIAVLTRTNEQATRVQATLRDRGIPSVVTGAMSVFAPDRASAVDDAGDLQRMLEALIEPGNPRALRTALVTSLVGVSAVELARMDDGDTGSFDAWNRSFSELSELWQERGFVQMMSAARTRLGIPARLLGRPDGERRMTNFAHLVELVHVAGVTLHLGPRALVGWLAARRSDKLASLDEEQIRLDSDEPAVIITTVHKSKGLEYPIVYCPFLWDTGIRPATEVFVHEHGKLALHFFTGRESPAEQQAHAAYQQYEEESLADQLRLLYVAMTRAKHRTVLAWGVTAKRDISALDYSLFGHDLLPASVAALRTTVDALDGPSIRARLSALAAGSAQTIVLAPLSDLAASPSAIGLAAPPVHAPSLAHAAPAHARPVHAPSLAHAPNAAVAMKPVSLSARTLACPIPRSHALASFTQLSARSHALGIAHGEGRDRDEHAPVIVEPPQRPPPSLARPSLLLEFPRGPEAGTFFHEIFEHAEFSADSAILEALAKERLARHGYPGSLARSVADAVVEICATPFSIGDGELRLADIPRTARLDELEFHLPVRSALPPGTPLQDNVKPSLRDAPLLSPSSLAQVFADHPSAALDGQYHARVAELGFAPLAGFLKGYIDLVFRHGGRYYLADYKTNHLGDTLASYETSRLGAAMSDGHYYLQYHLYALALHRHLEQRLRDYDYEEHFGGVHYLFVKGMTRGSGTLAGSFFEKPPRARLNALSALFAARAPVNAASADSADAAIGQLGEGAIGKLGEGAIGKLGEGAIGN